MGEYAMYKGERIKIGTCEDMYYLRADQAPKVRKVSGSLDPNAREEQEIIRFRFPWPDEDQVEPGAFESFDRAVGLSGDIPFPEGLEHHSVQFWAQGPGYLVSLPCPEGPAASHGLHVHRNGFGGRVKIVQQAYRVGVLAVICECGGCGARFNLPTWAGAEPVIVACRAEADKAERQGNSRAWWDTIADRIAAGYTNGAAARP